MKLSEYAVNRPVTMVMVTLSLIVLGAISLTRLPLEQLPNISSSGINVRANYDSSSPEEIERLITLPLEEVLATLSNVDQITATSSQNRASVRIDFVAGTDMDLANMEVRERVDQVRGDLPDDLDHVQIWRWQSDQRELIEANIAWRGGGDRLGDITRKVIEPRLLRLNGVANVVIEGLEEKQLIVALDQQLLEAHNVSLPALAWQVSNNNVNVSLGHVMEGERRYQVRAIGEFRNAAEIGALPLLNRDIRLQDVGQVKYEYPEKKRFERLNGNDAVDVEIFKAPSAPVIEVAEALHRTLDKIEAEYGGDLTIDVVRDRSESVLREVNNLGNAAFLGAILAVGIIFAFLRNIRSTLVVAAAIPTAALCVFTGMYVARQFFGSTITLNMVSMMGLMLAVGMLVDPAIVTLESIFRRRQEEGDDARQASLRGSREVGMAVVASALTTMCVFVPFFFLNDSRMGTWMRDAGLSICLAVMVSMIVSLSLIPLATSRLFKVEYDRYDNLLKGIVLAALLGLVGWLLYSAGWQGTMHWLSTWWGRIWGSVVAMEWNAAIGWSTSLVLVGAVTWQCWRRGMRDTYAAVLSWTLDHRLIALVSALGLMGGGVYLFMQMEQQGTPWTPERRVDISLQIERSYSLAEIKEIFDAIEDTLLTRKDELDIESLSTNFRLRRGRIRARLVDADDGTLSTMAAGGKILKLLPEKVGVTYKRGRTRSWAGRTQGVEVVLMGRDAEVLAVLAEEVSAQLAQLPGVQDVDTSMEETEEEIRVEVDRDQALSYGLSPQDVASTINTALSTRRTSTFKTADREIDLVMQLEEEDRMNLEQLKNSRYESRDGTPVQLASLASFQLRQGPEDIKRTERQQTITVFANTKDREAAYGMTKPVKEMMASIALPPGYSWDLGRAARRMDQDSKESNFTMLFAVLLIYLIMASLFESFIHPFTIMLSIPFSLIGVALGFYALDVPLDMNGIMGLLILFGIVVNNGIVMVDHINHFRREGMSRRQAILRGGQNRMRPIMMTASTTILNLMPLVLPMIYGTAEGFAKRWGPVGLVVVCGLGSSTLLTLLFAPVLYSLLDDSSLWMRKVVRSAYKS
jgi:HAE1 family hydrophobic/amphiphilic exporter-1